MLAAIEDIVANMEQEGVPSTMEKYYLSPRDIALLVRLKYLYPSEVEKFNLSEIEKSVPL